MCILRVRKLWFRPTRKCSGGGGSGMMLRWLAPPALVLCTCFVNWVGVEPQGVGAIVSSLLKNGHISVLQQGFTHSALLWARNQRTTSVSLSMGMCRCETRTRRIGRCQAWEEERKEVEILPTGDNSEPGEEWQNLCQSYLIQSISPHLEIAWRCSKKRAAIRISLESYNIASSQIVAKGTGESEEGMLSCYTARALGSPLFLVSHCLPRGHLPVVRHILEADDSPDDLQRVNSMTLTHVTSSHHLGISHHHKKSASSTVRYFERKTIRT